MVSCRVYTIHGSVTVFYYIGESRQKKMVILAQGHEMHTRNPTSVNRKYVTLFALCQSVYKYIWSVH